MKLKPFRCAILASGEVLMKRDAWSERCSIDVLPSRLAFYRGLAAKRPIPHQEAADAIEAAMRRAGLPIPRKSDATPNRKQR